MDIGKLCRLCRNIIHDDNFELLENYVSEILKNLFIKVNLGNEDPIICDKCATNLQNFDDFKWNCLNTENRIQSFKDLHTNSTVDLKEVFLNENKGFDINDNTDNQKICRFCMKISKYEFTQLHDTKENVSIISMLQKHVPELNLNVTEELIACNSCINSLQKFHDFIIECSDMEKKIAKFTDDEGTDNSHIQLNELREFTYNTDAVRQKDIYDKCKTEGDTCIKIKLEDLLEENTADMGIKTEEVHFKMEQSDSPDTDASQCDIRMYKCHECSFTTKRACNLAQHNRMHQRPPREVTCDLCPYKTRYKYLLKRHSWTHNDPPEVKRFSCQLCTYTANFQSKIKCHMGIHQSPSEVTMYKCDICPYKTRFKSGVKRHSLKHKDPSQLQMFSCQLCTYRAKFKCDLNRHMTKHENFQDPKIMIYKCDFCSYRAKLKRQVDEHMLVHKSPSEVTMYKCTECTFATKYKLNLQKHSIIHKNPDEITMFKCDSCSYEAIRLRNLKRHMIKHKSISEITLLGCHKCSYKTKYKEDLKRHMMVHKSSSELPIYKCKHCSYESRYKQTLKRHMLTHVVADIVQ